MAGLFETTPGGGAAIALDEVEVSILRSLAVQMLELIGPGPADGPDADPLAALFAEGPTTPPDDPALARLFPDAYGTPGAEPDDEQRAAAAEFRRYTEPDLRARKRDDALAVVRSLDGFSAATAGGRGGVLRLDAEQCRHWLGALNDLRLTLGARLEVTDDAEDERLYRLPDDDPVKPLVMAYLWLGAMQESLVEALTA
ncbi:DUF2017 domain-containing protein [Streptacidiphilus sp. ASG 303]|uniref:DUF2017 domain-containing protein n=1 Tax=Streptacidiphilus sp. ASG 303 TaxID=2896847 RepID=UPI001E496A8A|nr:DUF2017 domain-containing protein [Streptacidiphilus sp. ASG 303]MCD0485868.1 DUF2017 domain-containing protein [Streptacidiphilus sp. ASG 303]